MAITYPLLAEMPLMPDCEGVTPHGADWLSPYRWAGGEPENQAAKEAHEQIVRDAKAWLRGSAFAWIETIAEVYGLMMLSDGCEVAILSPGHGLPVRLIRITLGFITDATELIQSSDTLQ